MIALVVALCGAGLGAGLWALLVWWRPPQPSLGQVLALACAAPPDTPRTPTPPAGTVARLTAPAARLLARLGLPTQARRRDLRILGRAPETLLAHQAALAVAGLLAPTLAQAVMLPAGIPGGWALPVLGGLLGAAAGFWVPDQQVRTRAARARTSARHALAAYLSLVRVTLAGGAGVETALWDAAGQGDGPTFARLRRALFTAQLTRTTPWARLRQLGEQLDIPELAELAASVALAGTEGATVRASLAARAAALRTRDLTTAEGEAHAATERMSLPVALLFTGFLIFLGYPALAVVLASF